MLESPLLLVFDEPTAVLDPFSEHLLFERVAAPGNRSTLLISHRFSTVRMADWIVVLRAGRVVEAGTHQDLVAQDGLYAELYGLQARAYG
jgi:ATP-binding cassette subfamily B protein